MKASVATLRECIRFASINDLDNAIDMVVHYIKSNLCTKNKIEQILRAVPDNPEFNQHLKIIESKIDIPPF